MNGILRSTRVFLAFPLLIQLILFISCWYASSNINSLGRWIWHIGYPAIYYASLSSMCFLYYKRNTFTKTKLLSGGMGLVAFSAVAIVIVGIHFLVRFRWPMLNENTAMTDVVERMIRLPLDSKAIPVFGLLLSVILGPIVEEIYFRKILFCLFDSRLLYVVVSSFVFALLHLVSGGFVSAFALGAALSVGYIFIGRIWPIVLLHALYNLIAILA